MGSECKQWSPTRKSMPLTAEFEFDAILCYNATSLSGGWLVCEPVANCDLEARTEYQIPSLRVHGARGHHGSQLDSTPTTKRRSKTVTTDFQYDVFLSHSSKDKAVVREIAKRLRVWPAEPKRLREGWFDEWVLKAGDSIPAKIEAGLEYSRVLVLCMSAQAFGSDWARLESDMFRFRDPLNKEDRFILPRFDDGSFNGSLAQFLHSNWLLPDPPRAGKPGWAHLKSRSIQC